MTQSLAQNSTTSREASPTPLSPPPIEGTDIGKVLGIVEDSESNPVYGLVENGGGVVVSVPPALQPYLAQAVQEAIQYALQNQTPVTMSKVDIASEDVAATQSLVNTVNEYIGSGKQVWISSEIGITLVTSIGPGGYACMLAYGTAYGVLTAYCSTAVVNNNAYVDIWGIVTPRA